MSNSNIFLDFSIPEIVSKIQDKEISFKDIYNSVNKTVTENENKTHAWSYYDQNQLEKSYNVAEQNLRSRGYLLGLEGIPFGVKDIFNTKELPTQMGSPIWKDFTPGNNARVVDSLLSGGAVIAGKTVTAEFAVHSLNETLNPHHPDKTPGTSSSGSAAAVASGMVPFSLATQTAGSITRPSSFCGVWGMKPSFGMIPRTGVLKTTDSLDTIGFITSHGKNLRTILDQVRVKGLNYPFVYERVDLVGPKPKDLSRPWKVGFIKTHVWDKAEDYAKSSLTEFISKLGKFPNIEIEEISWPQELTSSHETHSTIYNKSLSYYFKTEKKHFSQMTPMMFKMIELGEKIDANSYKMALINQEKISSIIDQLFSPYDIVISLGTSSSAPDRHIEEIADPSLIWTMSHIPSVCVPLFRCGMNLPYGPQFVSRKWNDYLLMQFIEELIEKEIIPSGSAKIL